MKNSGNSTLNSNDRERDSNFLISNTGNIDVLNLDDIDSRNSSVPESTTVDENRLLPFTFKVNVNGSHTNFSAEAQEAATGIMSMKAPLFPSISILSENTRVWCRFCEADIVYRSRLAIGAPPGVRVYSIDGSLLLGPHD